MYLTGKLPLVCRRFIHSPLLLITCLALSACSHDRYLFLERADLTDLKDELAEQRTQLNALQTQTDQQFDLLETRQQMRATEILDQLSEQRAVLARLAKASAESGNQLKAPMLPPPVPAQGSGRYQGKLIVGEVESFYLAIPGVIYEARIDSGATTSSLHATNIQRFERDSEPWVRFDIIDPNSDTPITLERALVRNVRILQSGTEDAERRAVVELPFVIGDHRQLAEFTLTDRTHLAYPVLIGRNILRDLMLIDVGREHLTQLPDELRTTGESES